MTRKANQPEVDRLKSMLVTIFRNLGLTHRDVEEPIGAPNGYWSKVMSGERDFRLEHVLELCEATGMEAAEFFLMAYVAYADRPLSDAARRYLVQRSAGNGDPLEAIARFREAGTLSQALNLTGPATAWLQETAGLRQEVHDLRQALGLGAPPAPPPATPAEPSPAPEAAARRPRGRPPKRAAAR